MLVDSCRKFLSVGELAEYLGVTKSWVRIQVARRTIPFIKVGRFVKFDFLEVERWIEKRRVQEESWS